MGNNGKNYTCSKLKKAAEKLILLPFSSFCSSYTTILSTPCKKKKVGQNNNHEEKLSSVASEALMNSMSEICEEGNYTATVSCKNVCTICLEALVIKSKAAASSGSGSRSLSLGKAIFSSSDCGHSFHMSCISSYISHGRSLTCPVCRVQWTTSSSPSPSPSPSQVVHALRCVDRLAIVGASSSLRPMTWYGKRTALHQDSIYHGIIIINYYYYYVEGIRKGIQILRERMYKNPYSCILHLSHHHEYHHPRSRPSRSCSGSIIIINDLEMLSSSSSAISVHHIHVDSTASLMLHLHEFLRRRDPRIIN